MPLPASNKLKALRKRYFQRTAALRVTPDFIIIGAMKSGTTTLFSCLLQHPQLPGSYSQQPNEQLFKVLDHDFGWNN